MTSIRHRSWTGAFTAADDPTAPDDATAAADPYEGLNADESAVLRRILGEPRDRIRFRRATEINGHKIEPQPTAPGGPAIPCHDYEVWTQPRPGAPWTLRGWVSRMGGWMALPVDPQPIDSWTEPVGNRDEAARDLLSRWPDRTGATSPDPDADTNATGRPAPSFDDVLAVLVADMDAGRTVPRGFAWRRQTSTTGKFTHLGIRTAAQADRIRDVLRSAGFTAHTVSQQRGRPLVEVVIAPPVRFNARKPRRSGAAGA